MHCSNLYLLQRNLSSRLKFSACSSRFLSTIRNAADIIESLQTALPSHVEISVNPYELQSHGKGESYHPTMAPFCIVYPENTDDVVAIARHCYANHVPVIPYGAGTSVEGHVAALHGGICVDMTKLDSIEFEENPQGLPDPFAKVGAGVTRKRLNKALRHTGMQFVVDPGADASIGGMVGKFLR